MKKRPEVILSIIFEYYCDFRQDSRFDLMLGEAAAKAGVLKTPVPGEGMRIFKKAVPLSDEQIEGLAAAGSAASLSPKQSALKEKNDKKR